jgi:general secretion pathway protein L
VDLNTQIDLDFGKFWHWWTTELSFLMPPKVKQFITDKRGTVLVCPEGKQFVLRFVDATEERELATLDRNENGAVQYKALLANDEKLAKAQWIIRLSDCDAVQRELSLPEAAKENLQQVVAYELDRYTPFTAEQVYFAVEPLSVDNDPGQIKVMLVLALRETIDAIYEDAKAMGMSPVCADAAATPNLLPLGHHHYNLLPERLRPKTAYLPRIIHGGLLAMFAGLLVAAMVMPVWLQHREVQRLQARVDRIEKEAKKVNELQAEMDAMVEESQQLLNEKSNAPAMVVVLNALSALIRDNTWLAYVQFAESEVDGKKHMELQLQGESPNASTLISVLEASDIFANARFVSPVTQDSVSKLERFQISVDATPAGGIDGGRKS